MRKAEKADKDKEAQGAEVAARDEAKDIWLSDMQNEESSTADTNGPSTSKLDLQQSWWGIHVLMCSTLVVPGVCSSYRS